MPSPSGRVPFRVEGQSDMPINHDHLGEVHPTRDRFLFPKSADYSPAQFMKVGSNRLAPQPEGLPRSEQVALALSGHSARDRFHS